MVNKNAETHFFENVFTYCNNFKFSLKFRTFLLSLVCYIKKIAHFAQSSLCKQKHSAQVQDYFVMIMVSAFVGDGTKIIVFSLTALLQYNCERAFEYPFLVLCLSVHLII